MTHSPTPWKWDAQTGCIVDANDKTVAGFDMPSESTTRPSDAKLIAAAPELLEALDDCRGVLQSFEDQLKGRSFAVTDVLRKARAAIAKVKLPTKG